VTLSLAVDLPVSGMRCAGCTSKIEDALATQAGVASSRASVVASEVRLELAPGPGVPAALAGAVASIEGLGFAVARERRRFSLAGATVLAAEVERRARAALGVLSVVFDPKGPALEVEAVATSAARTALDAALRDVGVLGGAASSADPDPLAGAHRREARLLALELAIAGIAAPFAMALSMRHMLGVWHALPTATANLAQLAVATPVMLVSGARITRSAWLLARRGTSDMNTLVALGTWTAFAFSALVALAPGVVPGADVHFESAVTILLLVLVGRALDERARTKAREAVGLLLALAPHRATVRRGEAWVEIDVAELTVTDRLLVRPGERIAADGTIRVGTSAVDRSLLSGESLPVEVGPGDAVAAGTINTAGALEVEIEKLGGDTLLGRIVEHVRAARMSRAPIQRAADAVAARFVPVVLVLALLTFVAWHVFGPSVSRAVTAAVAVLVIACPCALGLATPLAITVAFGAASRRGLLFRGGEALERAASVDTVVFDKTGTLTEGRPAVARVVPVATEDDGAVLALAAAVLAGSEHPLARAVTAQAAERKVVPPPATPTRAHAGRGAESEVRGRRALAGSARFLDEAGIAIPPALAELAEEDARAGRSIVYVAHGMAVVGFVALADPPRADAAEAVRTLARAGITVAMATGDNAAAATAVARELGIDTVHAGLLPADKLALVERLEASGRRVAMVGDGVNDAPALARATLGVAMGSGTDVALESAGVAIHGGQGPEAVASALALARRAMRVIRQNLWWAFGYNLAALPVAAGVLYPVWGLQLDPMVGAFAMVASSASVSLNSLRLARAE